MNPDASNTDIHSSHGADLGDADSSGVAQPLPRTRPDLDAIAAYVPGKTQPGALKLASNEMSLPPLPAAVSAITQAIENPATSVNRYPDMGTVALRDELSAHLGVDANNIAVGCGSSALCLQLVQATASVGDEVIFPWRSFEAYPILTKIAGATPVAIPLDDQHRNDLDAMAAAITPRTRLIFVCNPNNPTGTTVSREQFEAFMAKVPADVVVALDEAYIEFATPTGSVDAAPTTPAGSVDAAPTTPAGSVDAAPRTLLRATDIIADYPNLVGLRTFSKVYGLAALRVGYAFAAPAIIEALNKVCIPFSVNTFAQVAAVESLRAPQELRGRVAAVTAERIRVTDAINTAAGCEVVVENSQANFIWIPEGRVAFLGRALDDASFSTSTALSQALAEKGVLVRCFAGEGVRITVTNAAESDRLLAALGI